LIIDVVFAGHTILVLICDISHRISEKLGDLSVWDIERSSPFPA
jgi:hypothetical protein